ncbi:EamA family transporter [Vibrio sp. 10N]|uniref:EamA family transporter n=1 Tax=Vibrio sp. 10N TaxID=3058938 RepID=UPI0030C744D5
MTLYAALLVIFSALLHAGWNILGKSNSGSGYSFTLGASLSQCLLLAPFIIWCFWQIGFSNVSPYFWGLLALSAVGQVIYLVGLLRAYQHGDIGVIYPIARALPVLMVGVGAWFFGQSLHISAWAGFAILTLGCLLVPVRAFRQLTVSAYANLGVLWAFVAAVGTTIYSIIDKEGINWLMSETSSLSPLHIAILYLGLQTAGIALLILVWLLLTKQVGELSLAWKYKRQSATAGVMMGLTYGIVLFAMTMVENVSYVVALRQVSIIFGVFMGMWFLKEPWLNTRILGVILVSAGLVIALAI